MQSIFNHLLCQNMVDEGYAATQILTQLHECVIEQDLSDKQKSTITEKMAVSHIIRCCFFCSYNSKLE